MTVLMHYHTAAFSAVLRGREQCAQHSLINGGNRYFPHAAVENGDAL